MSRSYLAGIIPLKKSGESLDIYDTCGKGASFMGAVSMELFVQIIEKSGGSMVILAIMLLTGYVLFRKAAAVNAPKFQ